jgi:hypothetical protein
MLIAIIKWREGAELRDEVYGPWTAQADGSHLDEISAFVRKLVAKAPGRELVEVALYVLTPPDEAT